MLVFRADAGPEVGVGHVFRCMALAQQWQELGGQTLLVMARHNEAMEARLRREGVPCRVLGVEPRGMEDADQTRGLALAMGASWLVADGYGFDAGWMERARPHRIALWTDYRQCERMPVDLLINQSPKACPREYEEAGAARAVLGLRYLVLRRDLRAACKERSVRRRLRRVLVTFGGGAFKEPYVGALAALRSTPLSRCEAVVLAGANNPYLPEIREAARGMVGVTVLPAVDDLATLAASCDLAIIAGGGTVWELAALGLPSMVVCLAPNQASNALHLDEQGGGISLGSMHEGIPGLMASAASRMADDLPGYSQRAACLVDGDGARRICEELGMSEGGNLGRLGPGASSLKDVGDRSSSPLCCPP